MQLISSFLFTLSTYVLLINALPEADPDFPWKVFHVKWGYETKYSLQLDVLAADNPSQHSADVYIAPGVGHMFEARIRNVEIDEKAFEMIDVEDFLMLLRDPIIFQFDESGLIDLFENEDLFDPRVIFYDEKYYAKIRAGERTFTKKSFIPMTEKRCSAQYQVNDEDDEVYKVNITVDSKCLQHPMVTTNIEMYQELNKKSLGLMKYVVTQKITQRVHQSTEIKNHKVEMTLNFVEFVKIFDEPLEVIDDIEDFMNGEQSKEVDADNGDDSEEDSDETVPEKDEL